MCVVHRQGQQRLARKAEVGFQETVRRSWHRHRDEYILDWQTQLHSNYEAQSIATQKQTNYALSS